MKLLKLSLKVDPGHWDHWALDHSGCPITLSCDGCGGTACMDEIDDLMTKGEV